MKAYKKRDKETVSFMMSRIKGKNTGIELTLRKALKEKGFHYRCNSSSVFGHPDIVNSRLKIAIFCDSEFWHGYNFAENKEKIHANTSYWIPKIERNIKRDQEVNEELKREGYVVLRYWGKQIEKDLDVVVNDVMKHVSQAEEINAKTNVSLVKTTLCYIKKDDQFLMLHRIKEKEDPNKGKWIGVGGHVEDGESVIRCLKREVKEETGFSLLKSTYLGSIDFLNDIYPSERMFLFLGTDIEGQQIDCDEGDLKWVPIEDVLNLELWEGDRLFLPLAIKPNNEPFKLTLLYHGGDLVSSTGPFYKKKKSIKKSSRKIKRPKVA